MSIYRIRSRKGKWRYYYQFQHDWKFYRGGGGFNSKPEALAQEARARTYLVSPDKISFEDVCKEYFKHCREDLQQTESWIHDKELFTKAHFTGFWKYNPILRIGRNQIEQIVQNRRSNRDIRILKGIFNFAMGKGWINKNPTEGITFRAKRRERYVPSMDDFRKIISKAEPYDQQLLIILFCTAGRISEVLSLKWEDVYNNYLILRSRKHRYGELKDRKIPLSGTLKEALDWLRQHKKDEWIFSNPKMNNRYLRRPKLMRNLCKKAGIKKFGFHSIRHLSASMISKENVPLKDVSEFLGHTSLSTTSIYLHSLEEGKKEISEKLAEGLREKIQ